MRPDPKEPNGVIDPTRKTLEPDSTLARQIPRSHDPNRPEPTAVILFLFLMDSTFYMRARTHMHTHMHMVERLSI